MNSSNGGVHHPQCTAKLKQQGPWSHELSWMQPPLLLGAASCSRCYSTVSATRTPYFQTCCTVYVLFHQPHILEVHFTKRVSELFDASNLLQHVGTSNSFNLSGLNSKSSWGVGGGAVGSKTWKGYYSSTSSLLKHAHPVPTS